MAKSVLTSKAALVCERYRQNRELPLDLTGYQFDILNKVYKSIIRGTDFELTPREAAELYKMIDLGYVEELD